MQDIKHGSAEISEIPHFDRIPRKMKENDWVILELSSFQLHTMRKSPEIAVITNISPNHLDMHKGLQGIYRRKEKYNALSE